MKDSVSMPVAVRSRSIRVAVALAVTGFALVGGVLSVAPAAGADAAQSEQSTIRVVTEAAEDGNVTARIVLSSAPDGLSGYLIRASVADAGVARIDGASYPDSFGLSTDPTVGDDGSTITLEAVDLDGNAEAGATNVTLATVQLSAQSSGETRLTVEPVRFDTDGGDAFEPTTRAGTLAVGPGDGGTSGSDVDRTVASGPDMDLTETTSGVRDGTAMPSAGEGENGAVADSDTATTTGASTTGGTGDFPVALVVVALGLFLASGAVLRGNWNGSEKQ